MTFYSELDDKKKYGFRKAESVLGGKQEHVIG